VTCPIGNGVFSYLTTSFPAISDSILALRDSVDRDKYTTVSEWLSDVQQLFHSLARDFGVSSDLGLSLLTLLQMVEDGAAQLMPKPIDLTELDAIISEFEMIAETAPNSLAEFEKMRAEKTAPVPQAPIQVEEAPVDNGPPLDTYSIYQDVLALKTDKDLERIVDIVSRYETSYAHVKDVIEIDLTRVQPGTLRRIHNYVTKVAQEKVKK
jgi:hypothetical protein